MTNPSPTPPTLSVVVPATDRPPTLRRAVASFERAAGSHGDGAGAAESAAPRVEIIVVDRPRGLSAPQARNVGAARAAGDVVVFVDADVEIHADALDRIAATLHTRPEVTAVFGSYDDAPPAPGTVSAFRNLLHHHVHQTATGPAETFWSGLGAIRREAFLAVGGFDAERFAHPSVEDIDLGARLRAGGARILLDPRIQGTHLKTWTVRSMVYTDFARRGVPWVALQLRTGRGSTALNLGWRHRASAACCVLAALGLAARRPAPALAALAVMITLNAEFYALLLRNRGQLETIFGVGLHVLHQLVAVASVPAGMLAHARERRAKAVASGG